MEHFIREPIDSGAYRFAQKMGMESTVESTRDSMVAH